MKKIFFLALGLSFSLNISAATSYDTIFGYQIGSSIKNPNIKPIDQTVENKQGFGNSYEFKPLSNDLNISFDDYKIISDSRNQVIYGIYASKELESEELCQKEIEKVRPIMIKKYGSPDMIDNNLIHFTDSIEGFKTAGINCGSNMLYFSTNDIRLNM